MRIVVTGSRDYESLGLVHAVLWEMVGDHGTLDVACGGSGVVDLEVANLGYDPKVYRADWSLFGKKAGPIRNRFMLDDFKPVRVVAFWNGKSRGTLDCITAAVERGIDVFVWAERKRG